ncbi:hypothetical protein [Nocardia sp. SSK8]|uniref:hypothetical protein n=1 Tax=Nocardia sp. SSK8 TaxID=3120154 RepID=UPI00300AC599
MSDFEHRIIRACDWLRRTIVRPGDGVAGWGWSADVAPNPQDTAEVVCALVAARRPVPDAPAVLAMMRRDSVSHHTEGEWVFQAPVDAAWRLRALRRLGEPRTATEVLASRHTLLTTQDPETGGWALSDGIAPISVTATTAAVRSLLDFPGSDDAAAEATVRGVSFLVTAVLDDDSRAASNHAAAHIAHLLGNPAIAALGGPRLVRAHTRTIDRILAHLDTAPGTLEEEQIHRGAVAQTWYHSTLQQSVAALATAGDRLIFHPTFRTALVQLLDFQQSERTHRDHGGFRTSREGIITSYATAQAVEALTEVHSGVRQWVNPATVFDMICRESGAHHTDPQPIAPTPRAPIAMNSSAGAAVFGAAAAAGITIITLALAFDKGIVEPLGEVSSRALVVWGSLLIWFGSYCWAATVFARHRSGRVGTLVFAAATTIVFPTVAFLLG